MKHYSAVLSCVFIALLLLVGIAGANGVVRPVAAFTANNVSGNATLPVSFTDLSTSPYGWAWYFGDETYSGSWSQVNASAMPQGRDWMSSVVLPDGSIVLMAGYSSGQIYNDTWRSWDSGAMWTQINDSSGWEKRYNPGTVVLSDGSIVLTGGFAAYGEKNDTWRSTDGGYTWTLMNESSGWPGRWGHSIVALSDGSIVLFGGRDNIIPSFFNDVWRSTDQGATWTQVTPAAGWPKREGQCGVTAADGSIVMAGGYGAGGYVNDTWRSVDKGATWTQVNTSSGWIGRSDATGVVVADGTIVLAGGLDNHGNVWNDTWRSADYGYTWSQMKASSGWPARHYHTSVALPNGSILIMGGSNSTLLNDVWKLNTAGSTAQHPSHSYATPGSYTVTMTAYNPAGSDTERKIGYITVAKPFTTVPFINTVTPLAVNRNMSTEIVITGSNFIPGSTIVEFRNQSDGVINLTPIINVTSTRINGTLAVPGNASTGSWNARVIIRTGGENVKTNVLTVQNLSKPTIESVTPAMPWYRNTTVKYSIKGQNFEPGLTTVMFWNKSGVLLNATGIGITSIKTTFINGTFIVPVDASAVTPYNITIITADGGTGGRDAAITVAADPKPTVVSVSPAIPWYRNQTYSYTITGTNFEPGKTNVIIWNKTGVMLNATSVGLKNVTVLRINGTFLIPYNASMVGPYNITVTTIDGGTGGKDAAITITNLPKPAIDTVSPAMPWYRNTTVKYSIKGKYFKKGQTTVTFWNKTGVLLNATSIGITSISDTFINGTFIVPVDASTVTPYNITVTTIDGGTGGKDAAITIASSLKPTIISVSPAIPWYRNQSYNYTITGTNFEPGKTTLTIWNKSGTMLNATSVGVTNVTALRINGTIIIPNDASIVGPYNITVTTVDGGTGGRDAAITVNRFPAPTVTLLTPATGYPNTTVAFTITGKDFQAGKTIVVLSHPAFGELPTALYAISSTQIIGKFDVPPEVPLAAWKLNVTTVDGGLTTKPAAFTFGKLPKPTITSVVPPIAYRGTNVTFVVYGKYFQNGIGRTSVNLTRTGMTDLPVTLTSVYPSRVTGYMEVPAGYTNGTWQVNVTTVDGGSALLPGAVKVL